ncbi:unnamed protein product [Durusdinium trenchii]|uniref:Uncharacterized protein n=1 Tax=Durusdinium trenchii TaxID=1381693 RepID=A0ABP0RX69_9DINO
MVHPLEAGPLLAPTGFPKLALLLGKDGVIFYLSLFREITGTRVAKRRKLLEGERESVRSLNRLAGFMDESAWPSTPLNFAQRSALWNVHEAHSTRAPPPEAESPQAALRQLLRKKVPSVYDDGGGPGLLVGYERSKVSLPRGQRKPVDLAGLLPQREKEQLQDFRSHMLLSPEEMAAELEKGLDGCCYLDPVLQANKKAYHQFIAGLIECELLGFTITPKVQIGAFFVSKKNQKQRLVVDARRANRLFRTPPTTALGSVDCWSRLEVEQPNRLFIAQEDVKDYFYRLGISKELGEYFSLPAIDLHALQQELPDLPPELADQHDAPIYPHLQVLPMGFSWSFHLAHEAHLELCRRCIPRAPPLIDRRVAPKLGTGREVTGTAVMIYADNANHLGIERDAVAEDQKPLVEIKAGDGKRKPPREAALDTSLVFEDPLTVKPEIDGEIDKVVQEQHDFPEVDPDHLQEWQWHKLWNSRVVFKEPVHMIEARSVLAAVKHRSRDPHRRRKRITIFNDNLGVVLAVQKGRCHNYGLLRIVRRISAHALASGQRYHLRWLPSERNVADKDSRRWEEAKPVVQVFTKQKTEQRNPSAGPSQLGQVSGKETQKGSTETMTILELASLKDGQRKDYARRLEQFYDFVARHQLPIETEGKLDEAMCDFADELFLNGEDSHAGEKLKAALEYARPEGIREGYLHLPRFKRAMKGWRKLAPNQTRLPMLEVLKSAISGIMIAMRQPQMVLFNEVTYSTYGRPGEILRVQPWDIVAKTSNFSRDVIVLSPLERGESSKAGIFDETLILDDSRAPAPWLGELLKREPKQKIAAQLAEQPLWDFNAAQFLRVWRQCVDILGIPEIAQSPYQNRHGGASRDHLLKLRSVPEIQRRGRWASDASARIYGKPGRLQQAMNQFGQKWSKLGEDARQNFPRYYLNGTVPLPATVRKAVAQIVAA